MTKELQAVLADTGSPLVGVVEDISQQNAPSLASLFRPEAVTAASAASNGRPVALLPLSWTAITLVLVLMAALAATFLLLGTYTRSETAIGIVNSAGTSARVGAPVAGILSKLYVHEGMRVRAGEPLAVVSTERVGVDGNSIDDGTIDSLTEELAGLERRLGVLAAAFEQQRIGTEARLEALRNSKLAESAAEGASSERMLLARESLEKMRPAAEQGFISGEAMRRRKEEIIILQDAKIQAHSRKMSIAAQMQVLEAELQSIPYALVQQRGELLTQIARARRERDVARAQRGYLIRAAVSGVVTALQVRQGQSVDQRNALMTIAAADNLVAAELYVPSRAVGFVEPGQQVRLRYDAFPYQRFGAGTGSIRHVSLAVLRPGDVQAAVELKEPMYRVLVALDRPWLDAYGRRHHLQPGMALSADIILEERSFGAWLMEPILALRGRL